MSIARKKKKVRSDPINQSNDPTKTRRQKRGLGTRHLDLFSQTRFLPGVGFRIPNPIMTKKKRKKVTSYRRP